MHANPATPARRPFARSTATVLFPLLASLTLALSACSGKPLTPPISLPANLATDCEAIPALPAPFLDPERLIWEQALVALYADCKAKHRATVAAWPS